MTPIEVLESYKNQIAGGASRDEFQQAVDELCYEAALWRKHSPAINQMLTALDALAPLVLTRLKLQDAQTDAT